MEPKEEAVMDKLMARVEKMLRERGALNGGRVIVWTSYGESGFRVSILCPKGKKTLNERSFTFTRTPNGNLRDQANGIVGKIMSPVAITIAEIRGTVP
jgi:hypothetical protein